MTELDKFTSNARFASFSLAGFQLSVALNLAASNPRLTIVLSLAVLVLGLLAITNNQPARPGRTQQVPRPEVPQKTELEKRLQVAIAALIVSIVMGGGVAWIL